jgi:hypothetical protein
MNTLANSELLVLLPAIILVITLLLTALVKSNNLVIMAFAVVTGNVARATYTSEALVEKAFIMNNLWSIVGQWFSNRKDDAVILSQLAFWVIVYSVKALVKGIVALIVGGCAVVATVIGSVAFAAYKAGEYAVGLVANTYRKVRENLKRRVLGALGITALREQAIELRRENAKLHLQVRRLEILADVNVEASVSTRQVEANEMAAVLDAEFRTQLEALSTSDVQAIWMALMPNYGMESAFWVEGGINDIMAFPPVVAMKAYKQVVSQ